MDSAISRDRAASPNNNEPLRFVVAGLRAERTAEILPPDLKSIYLHAWRDAIGAAMDDCGWTYDDQRNVSEVVVERVRTGRPSFFDVKRIERRLARAANSVDVMLDTIVVTDPATRAAIDFARVEERVAFEWNITETHYSSAGQQEACKVVGSSYIDVSDTGSALAGQAKV